ncbi:MAG TPA: hypothetical protein DCS93_25775 [Microscillaceae bacterium]|nr:hypothetical protein [Microscillaceae bacterium]
MGLDIHIKTNDFHLWEYLGTQQGLDSNEKFQIEQMFRLSRVFCVLMSQHGFIHPVFYHLGELTQVDLSPIAHMVAYVSEEELDEYVTFAYETESEQLRAREEAAQSREKLKGNLETVLKTISQLSEKLPELDNWTKNILEPDSWIDKAYLENCSPHYNLDQDLKNLKHALEFLKSLGKDTVWFSFG